MDVRRVATAKGRASVGAFVVEGRRMLERGLRAGWAPRAILVSESLAAAGEVPALIELGRSRGARCQSLPDAELLDLADGRNSGLLTALFDLPRPPPLSHVLGSSRGQLFLAIVDVDEPGNVGALIRTALASDAAAVLCVGSSDPFHPKAVRTSLGSLFKLPIALLPDPRELSEVLRTYGIFSLAAVARNGVSLDRASWPMGSSIALLVGNETRGLAEGLRESADARVSIDLSTAADSFCVNAAAAVCLYEVKRRARLSSLTLSPLTLSGDLTRQEP